MSFKLVLLPPVNQEHWAERVRAAVPQARVEVCRDLGEAADAIRDADAAFGTLPPDVLARAERLRWLQAPMAGPPAGWYYPELVRHPVVVTNMREIFND